MIEHSGIGVRIQNILKNWDRNKWLAESIELYLFGDPEKLKNHSLPKSARIIPYTVGIYSLSEWFGHPKMKETDLLDIPHFNVPILYLRKCIVTIHDLIPWIFRDLHGGLAKRIYLLLVLNLICKLAKKIVCVSFRTREDFLRYVGSPKKELEVLYNGVDHNLFQPITGARVKKFRKQYQLPKNFLLLVGIGKGHKNFEFALRVLKRLWVERRYKIPVCIAGTNGKPPELSSEFSWESLPSGMFQILPRFPAEEMPFLYASATALLYPSLYEGFGLPILEAQAVGCPVISSDSSVLPEILENSAYFFDPKKENSLESSILEFSKIPETKLKSLRTLGIKNAKRFQWSDTLRKYSEILRDII